ncbi:MAG: hypothetical protein Q9208_008750 [Pyrenodesmia sp. 3 TL-2023]
MTLTLVQLLASALLLSRMSGSLSPAQADYHRIKRALVDQLEDTLKAQAAARKEGHTIQSLGNDDLFIHHALESLAETPRDVGASAPLFDALARIFFAVGGQYNIDLAGALAQFKVPKESSDRTKGWILQTLLRLSSEAVLLAQFGFSASDQRARKAIMAKSEEVAEWLVLKIEALFQHELSRLKRLKKRHSVATKIRITGAATAFQPSAEDTRTALDLLHAASHLATWFGELEWFDIIKDLCRDLISNQAFQPLRLKAMDVLLYIKQARTGLTDPSCSESNMLPRPLQAVKEQTASARVLRELDISRAVFMARQAANSSGIRFAMEELSKHQQRSPATTNCTEQSSNKGEDDRLSSAPLGGQAIEAKVQGSSESDEAFAPQLDLDRLPFRQSVCHGRSLDGDSDCDTDSSYSRQSPEVVGDMRFPSISDLKHQIAVNVGPPSFETASQSEKMTVLNCEPMYTIRSSAAKTQDLKISPNAEAPQYACGWQLCAKNSTIQELPGDEPSCELESPSLFGGSHGRFGSIPSRPWIDPSRTASPISHGAPDTPLTSETLHRRASQSIEGSSDSSCFNLQGLHLELQKPKTQLHVAKKIKFLQNAKKADYVALSPNSEYAAFVFPTQVQVCRLSYGLGALGTGAVKVMLASGKKAKFLAAELSNTHLIAISDKEIQVCCYVPLENSPTSVHVRQIEQNVRVNCVAISPSSDTIALGQRVRPGGLDRASIQYHAAIQLYSTALVPRESLKCQAAGEHEFPRHISFYADGQTMLYSNNRTLGQWTRHIKIWRESSLGALDAKGPGAIGITSITPVSLPSHITGPMNVPFCGINYESPKYYIVTSVLSNIAEDTSSYMSALSNRSRSKSGAPWCEHLVRSTVSGDGRLAAFLTQSGHLKLANLVASDGGSKLLMRNIPCDEFQAKRGIDANNAGKIGIRDGPNGYTVVMVDRHGNVISIRVTESEKFRQG